MAKYIGTYENETAIATAVNNNELSRPFVALAEDTDRVYYGPYADLAVIGDICVYDTTTQSLRFIHQADYNTTTYPTATYEPIGVIVTDQTSSLAGGVDRTVKILAKNWLDMNNPDTGNANRQNMYWGDDTVATGATSTTDGKANTATVLTFATGQADWRTDATISYTNGERMYPLFECAWRYHTSGTAQGDWYAGAKDELNPLLTDATIGATINSGFTAIGATSYYHSGDMGSSTEYTAIYAYCTWNNNWQTNRKKSNGVFWTSRALCQKSVLPINA